MNELKKLISKSAMLASVTAVMTAAVVLADGSGSGSTSVSVSISQQPCPSGSNCCWYPNGNIANTVAPPNVCCVKCGGAAGEAGYEAINVSGNIQYCKNIPYDPSNYPITIDRPWPLSDKVINSPCD